MSRLNFAIAINTTNNTAGGLRSALQGIQGFARSAIKPIEVPIRVARGTLGVLRDINVGLAPLVSRIDSLIDRGTRLEVTQNAFRNLLGVTGQQAQGMAQRLSDASQGVLRMAEAMEIANRALSSGMSANQLGIAIEFISKKAVATGKDVRSALDTVITGLARGSTLFLDDFGILVDGLEAVKRKYEAIKGAGAWDNLGPAAQKAETVRQAIEEMRQQMSKLGISGRETFFTWTRIKTEIGDASDKLVRAVAGSAAMRSALSGIRDTLSGIGEHFEKGGSFKELLLGKEGGPGLLSVAGTALANLAANAGRALAAGVMSGLAGAIDAFKSLKEYFAPVWDDLVTKLRAFIPEIPGLLSSARKGTIEWLGEKLAPYMPTESSSGTVGAAAGQSGIAAAYRRFVVSHTPDWLKSLAMMIPSPPASQTWPILPNPALRELSLSDSLRAGAAGIRRGISWGSSARALTGFMRDFPARRVTSGPIVLTPGLRREIGHGPFAATDRRADVAQLAERRRMFATYNRLAPGELREAADKTRGDVADRRSRGERVTAAQQRAILEGHRADLLAAKELDMAEALGITVQQLREAAGRPPEFIGGPIAPPLAESPRAPTAGRPNGEPAGDRIAALVELFLRRFDALQQQVQAMVRAIGVTDQAFQGATQ